MMISFFRNNSLDSFQILKEKEIMTNLPDIRLKPEVYKLLHQVRGKEITKKGKSVSFSDVIKKALVKSGMTEGLEEIIDE